MDANLIREIVAEEISKARDIQCVTMKIDKAATYLGVSEDVIRRECQRPKDDPKRIPHSRVGMQYFFRKETLDAWMAEQEGFHLKEHVVELPKSRIDKKKLVAEISENLAKLVEV